MTEVAEWSSGVEPEEHGSGLVTVKLIRDGLDEVPDEHANQLLQQLEQINREIAESQTRGAAKRNEYVLYTRSLVPVVYCLIATYSINAGLPYTQELGVYSSFDNADEASKHVEFPYGCITKRCDIKCVKSRTLSWSELKRINTPAKKVRH